MLAQPTGVEVVRMTCSNPSLHDRRQASQQGSTRISLHELASENASFWHLESGSCLRLTLESAISRRCQLTSPQDTETMVLPLQRLYDTIGADRQNVRREVLFSGAPAGI